MGIEVIVLKIHDIHKAYRLREIDDFVDFVH